MKEKQEDWKGFYTDAPVLRPGYVRPFFQLVFWVFFHPSAWKSHVATIDPTLDPALVLSQIDRANFANPRFRRLLSVLVGVPGVLWTLVAIAAYPRATLVLHSQASWIVFQNIVYIALQLVLAWMLFGLAASVSAVLTRQLAGGLAIVVLHRSLVGQLNGQQEYLAIGLGLGSCLAMTGVIGTWGTRRSRGALLGAVVGGLVASLLFRGITSVPMAYALKRSAGAGLNAFAALSASVLVTLFWSAVTLGTWSRRRAITASAALGVLYGLAVWYFLATSTERPHVLLWELEEFMSFSLAFVVATAPAGPLAGVLAALAGAAGGWSGEYVVGQLFGVAITETNIVATGWAWKTTGLVLGVTLNFWRPILLYPLLAAWNTVLFLLDQRRPATATSRLRYHSAFWDEHQRIPLSGLDDHIVLVHQRRPAEAEAALAYLSTSPSTHQRWAVRAVQIELDLLRLEACKTPEDIAAAAARASTRPDEPGDFQRAFERIAEDTGAALAQDSNLNRRLGLLVARDRLDALIRDLRLSKDRGAPRLERIAAAWSKALDTRIDALTMEAELAQEIDNPYITGVALGENVDVCAPRTEIVAEIERLLFDQRKPPLLLYGQRRMGKTSLLQNLKRLRNEIVPLFIDLQGPPGNAESHAGFLFNLARSAVSSARRFRNLALPPLTLESLADDPFTRFDVWLDEVEAALGDRTALLMMDEMEALDDAFEEGRFREAAVLGMLRNLIQHRPKLKILLAGSHDFEELVRWSSYLINVRTVRLGYLTEKEATRLVVAPIPGFPLKYEPEALARVLAVTRGHPFLVQLLCGEIVTHMNGLPPGERRLCRTADVEASVARALDRGEMYFGEVETRQAGADGAVLLRRLAEKGEGAVMDEVALARGMEGAGEVLRRLVRREIVEEEGGGYRFKVELLRRWFVSRRPVGARAGG